MANIPDLYNFYRRYLWSDQDFEAWKTGMVDHSRGMFEGLFNSAVLDGFGYELPGGMDVNVLPGIASGPSGYLNIIETTTEVEVTAPTTNSERALLVVRPLLVDGNFITKPTTPFSSVPLTVAQESEIVLIRGTEAASPVYPATEANDVILWGWRLYVGQTAIAAEDFDFEVRDIPGKNTPFQNDAGKYDDRLRPYRASNSTVGIKPSQLEPPAARVFSYVRRQFPSIFPKDSGGEYNPLDTVINLQTGAITGGDEASNALAPTIPTTGNAINLTIGINSDDELSFAYGTTGTRAQCFAGIKNQSRSGAGSVNFAADSKPVCFIVIYSADGANVTEIDVFDCRGLATVTGAITRENHDTDDDWVCPAGVEQVKVSAISKLFTQIDGTDTSRGGLTTDGAAYMWGSNQGTGVLGDGTSADKSSPVAVVGGIVFKQISVAPGTAMGLDIEGNAWAWGINLGGGLGDGTVVAKSSPVAVVGGLKFKQVECGGYTNYGLTVDGTLYAWGRNDAGQLGDDSVVPKSSPVAVVGGLKFKMVSAVARLSGTPNVNFALALALDGSLYAFGGNANGQLGDGTVLAKSSPVAVVGGLTFRDAKCGIRESYAIDTDNNVWAWGQGTTGQLGDNTIVTKSSPVAVVGGIKFKKISSRGTTIFGLDLLGNAYAWGTGSFGSLGNGGVDNVSSPVQVLGGFKFAQIARSLAITDNGDAYGWGVNSVGQIGNATQTMTSSPVAVVGGLTFRSIDTAKVNELVVDTNEAETYPIKVNQKGASFGSSVLYLDKNASTKIEFGLEYEN